MNIGFFLAGSSPTLFLHACALAREAKRAMGCPVVQLTDATTFQVGGVDDVVRTDLAATLLQQRIRLYSGCEGDWLLVDTDVHIRANVRGVFDDKGFDVALTDRNWPHLPQGEAMMHTMPFNTGVVFSRCPAFWEDVELTWLRYPAAVQADWMSEQRAVYDVVRTGRYRVKILPGMEYNYPPGSKDGEVPVFAALVHYKGPSRKDWRSAVAHHTLRTP